MILIICSLPVLEILLEMMDVQCKRFWDIFTLGLEKRCFLPNQIQLHCSFPSSCFHVLNISNHLNTTKNNSQSVFVHIRTRRKIVSQHSELAKMPINFPFITVIFRNVCCSISRPSTVLHTGEAEAAASSAATVSQPRIRTVCGLSNQWGGKILAAEDLWSYSFSPSNATEDD